MIYTVTFNPAIDYVVYTDEISVGEVNRANAEKIFFGGKGINVSLVLNELDVKSKALGFTAGFTGTAIENGIREKGVETDFIHLESGFSRINVKIKNDTETEINGKGPDIDGRSLNELYKKLGELSDGDTLVLAGSIPDSLPKDIYEKILEMLSGKNIRTVVDATKELLLNTLKYKPFLVKPNIHELGEMFGVKVNSIDEAEEYARRLRETGARNVLVSMGKDGALLLDEHGKTHFRGAHKGEVKNSVGAGDAMVAGFLAGLEQDGYESALKLATAAGSATAFSYGLAEQEDILKLMKDNC
ncbi:MAG: 1-phosphofructokinase [Oscillospiraceae bacterium]|nr:1-phosphofructokinase [Oscillospiraceae bacterium]